jgi:hypothetical protein
MNIKRRTFLKLRKFPMAIREGMEGKELQGIPPNPKVVWVFQ